MPTLIKKSGKNRPHTVVSMEEVADMIRNGEWKPEVLRLREHFPLLQSQSSFRRENVEPYTDPIPEVCFGAELRMSQGCEKLLQYDRQVTLQLSNLPSADEAQRLRNEAALIPYTRLAYVGADGHSLVLVAAIRTTDGDVPTAEEETQLLHQNAFGRLHYLYSSQLGICWDNAEPNLRQSVLMSYDPQLLYHADSEEYIVPKTATNLPPFRTSDKEIADPRKLPGYSEIETLGMAYEWCLRSALEHAAATVSKKEDLYPKALSLLADYCYESGLPIEFAIKRTSWKSCFQVTEDYLRLLFESAYSDDESLALNMGHVEKSALLTMRTEAFLRAHYELRRNVMTGVVQFRQCDGYHYGWQDLTESALNSMTNRALKVGLGSWDKDVRRLVRSDDVPVYEPLTEWLMNLPRWDGRDRVGSLIDRIPTDTPNVQNFMRLWLRSLVAHWLGRAGMRGNAIVPLLIGGQGCGKTSFCALLMPPELRDYYNDRVDFKSDTDLSLGLSSFALINIDEFDSLKRSQQPTLKYLLSKGDVKLRPPYGKHFVSKRRYASFIATTNKRHPLVDPTGSRRFVCIEVRAGEQIDFLTPIDYPQFFAQLLDEVMRGERYWLTDEENAELMRQNLPYQQPRDVVEMVDSLFALPIGETGQWMTVVEIVDVLKSRYGDLPCGAGLGEVLGKTLKARGYERRRRSTGVEYLVKCLR